MVWVRFPYTVKYNGDFYEGGKSFAIQDDDLPQMTEQGAAIVRAVMEPEPEAEDSQIILAAAPESPPAKRGRRKREQ